MLKLRTARTKDQKITFSLKEELIKRSGRTWYLLTVYRGRRLEYASRRYHRFATEEARIKFIEGVIKKHYAPKPSSFWTREGRFG